MASLPRLPALHRLTARVSRNTVSTDCPNDGRAVYGVVEKMTAADPLQALSGRPRTSRRHARSLRARCQCLDHLNRI